MIGDASRIGRIDAADLEHAGEKRRELEALGGKRGGAIGEIGVLGEQARVMQPQHAGAGTRRRHHVVEALECLDHLPGDGRGVLAVAGIIGWLAATGLRARHLDPRPGILDQLDRGKGDAWPEQIDQAGDEQADQRALLRWGRRGRHGAALAFTLWREGGARM